MRKINHFLIVRLSPEYYGSNKGKSNTRKYNKLHPEFESDSVNSLNTKIIKYLLTDVCKIINDYKATEKLLRSSQEVFAKKNKNRSGIDKFLKEKLGVDIKHANYRNGIYFCAKIIMKIPNTSQFVEIEIEDIEMLNYFNRHIAKIHYEERPAF